MAAIGKQPGYNIPLAFLGLVVPHLEGAFIATMLLGLLPFSMVLDIIWCSLHGPNYSSGAPLFGLM